MAAKKKPASTPMDKAVASAVKAERASRRAAGKTKSGEARKDAVDEEPELTLQERDARGLGPLQGPRKLRFREFTPSPTGNSGRTAGETEQRRSEAMDAVRGRVVKKTRVTKGGKERQVSRRIPPSVPMTLRDVKANRRFFFGPEKGGVPLDEPAPRTGLQVTSAGAISTFKELRPNVLRTVPVSAVERGMRKDIEKVEATGETIGELSERIKELPETIPTGKVSLGNVAKPGEKPKAGPIDIVRPGTFSDVAKAKKTSVDGEPAKSPEKNDPLWKIASRLSNDEQSRGQAPGNMLVQSSNRANLTRGTLEYLRKNVLAERERPNIPMSRRVARVPDSVQLAEFKNKLAEAATKMPTEYNPEEHGVPLEGGGSVSEFIDDKSYAGQITEAVKKASKGDKSRKSSAAILGPTPVVGEGDTAREDVVASGSLAEVNAELMKIKNPSVRKRKARGLVNWAMYPEGFPRQGASGVPGKSSLITSTRGETTVPVVTAPGRQYSEPLSPEGREKVKQAQNKPGSPSETVRVVKKIRKVAGIPKQSAKKDVLTQSAQRRSISDIVRQMTGFEGRGGGDASTAAYAEMSGLAAEGARTGVNAGIIANRPARKSWVGPTGTMDLKTQTITDEDMAKLRVEKPHIATLFDRVSGKGAATPWMSTDPSSEHYDPRAQESLNRSAKLKADMDARKTPLPLRADQPGYKPVQPTGEEKRKKKEASAAESARSSFLNKPVTTQRSIRENLYIQEPSVERQRDPGVAALIKDYAEYTGQTHIEHPVLRSTNRAGEMTLRPGEVTGLPREYVMGKVIDTMKARSGYVAPSATWNVYDPGRRGVGNAPAASTAPLKEQPTKGSEMKAPTPLQKATETIDMYNRKPSSGAMSGDQWK